MNFPPLFYEPATKVYYKTKCTTRVTLGTSFNTPIQWQTTLCLGHSFTKIVSWTLEHLFLNSDICLSNVDGHFSSVIIICRGLPFLSEFCILVYLMDWLYSHWVILSINLLLLFFVERKNGIFSTKLSWREIIEEVIGESYVHWAKIDNMVLSKVSLAMRG